MAQANIQESFMSEGFFFLMGILVGVYSTIVIKDLIALDGRDSEEEQ